MRTLKVLVIGSGSIGKRHANNICKLGHDCEIIGFREVADLGNLLRENSFDAVVIATASQVRREVLKPCFRNLIPVYIEKPVAFDSELIDEIYSLPDGYLEKCCAGFMMRFHPITQFLLGLDYRDVYSFSFEIGYNINLWREDWKFSKSYASKSLGGGVLLDLCHEIDLANLLFQPMTLKDVTCMDHEQYTDVDFVSSVSFSNSNNLIGSVSMDYLSPVNRRKLVVKSINFIDEIDFLTGVYSRVTGDDTIVREFPVERNKMFIDAIKFFLQFDAPKQKTGVEKPLLNNVKSSCDLIADAWSSRTFVGSVAGEVS